MSALEGEVASTGRRPSSLWAAPPPFIALSLVLQAAALAGSVVAVLRWPGDPRSWACAGLIFVLALGFDEASRRAARLRIRLSEELRTDMTSVWAIAAAAALPRGVAVTVLAAVLAYDWFRHHRPAGESLHRKLFVIASILLGVLAASVAGQVALDPFRDILGAETAAVSRTVSVVVAIIVYTVVQRALVTVGLLALGARIHMLLGSRDENLIEFATLCLGGLVALALHYQAALAVLALAPMITLHRGALVRELETAATTDGKTGLLNAVAWEHLAQREVARSLREGGPLAVLIIDIDHFKLVNDKYGHLVGDMILRGLGKQLSSVVREYDSPGRFGGEEFVVVLPDATPSVAAAIAERIRAQINSLTIADLATGVGPESAADVLAVSVGVAMLRQHGSELFDLLQAADAALYRAKSGGRNQVVLAADGTDGPGDRTREVSSS